MLDQPAFGDGGLLFRYGHGHPQGITHRGILAVSGLHVLQHLAGSRSELSCAIRDSARQRSAAGHKKELPGHLFIMQKITDDRRGCYHATG